MRVQGANSCEPRGTQANSRREASPTSSCRHFKQFAAGSFPLNYQLNRRTRVDTGFPPASTQKYRQRYRHQMNA